MFNKSVRPEETSGQTLQNKSVFQRIMGFREANILLILLVVAIIMTFSSEHFLKWANIRAMLLSFSTEGIVAVGMTVTFIVGGIDLSVGSMMAMAMAIAGRLFLGGMDPWLASGIAVIVCAFMGFGIGNMVTKVKLSHFVVTLAVQQICRGATYIFTKGTPLSLLTLPINFKFIGQGYVGPIPFVVILFVIIVVICDYLVRHSSIMRQVFFVGSNEKAARYSGINVDAIKVGAAIFTTTLAGIAGVIYMSRFGASTPGFGNGLEMTCFSACVIGGVSMNGGKGTVLGTILGMILLTFITTSMTLLNVSPHWQDLVRGAILLAAVTFDQLSQSKKSKKA